MLDINYIKNNKDAIQQAAELKNIDIDISELLDIYHQKKSIQNQIEHINKLRNELARSGKNARPTPANIAQGKELKNKLAPLEKKLSQLNKKYLNLMARVPIIPSTDTPIGKSAVDNKEIYKWGEIPNFNFTIKDHIQLGHDLDLLDFERGVKVSGYRGYYVKNELALLQLGLMQYALKKVSSKGYKPFIPPTLVREFVLFGSGYFAGVDFNDQVDEIYKIANKGKEADGTVGTEAKFLIGTSEPSLLAYYANEILDEKDLPLRICGFSPCYRSEIGSYGKDTRGLYRVHEFMKVEMVAILPADIALSDKQQEEMINISRELHEELKLPYRQLHICTGDLSAGKRKQYDLEAWIPSRNSYGETGSASNFLDWQARRLNVRYKDKQGDQKFVYMLNNTALPTPRITISILENYQQSDGSVKIPKILQPYVGKKIIRYDESK